MELAEEKHVHRYDRAFRQKNCHENFFYICLRIIVIAMQANENTLFPSA
jgi:hypothetical protein